MRGEGGEERGEEEGGRGEGGGGRGERIEKRLAIIMCNLYIVYRHVYNTAVHCTCTCTGIYRPKGT